jgi:Animal haem peroxidase
VVALCAAAVLVAGPGVAVAKGAPAGQPGFTRLFPKLKAFSPPDILLARELAPSMKETTAFNTPTALGAGYTFFGQFIDHDLTLDLTPLPSVKTDISTLVNHRTPYFDLDSVYGGGPAKSAQLYNGSRFRLSPGGRDVPRRPDGSAIIADPRNDENAIISQLHMVFLRLHNSFIDRGMTFEEAHRQVLVRYQKAVLTDFLPAMAGHTVTNQALIDRTPLYKANEDVDIPVEFTVAAYRFGHSMVRTAYRLAEEEEGLDVPFVQVFDGTPNDMTGGRPVPPDNVVYWPNFLQFPDEPAPVNVHRRIDPILADDLFNLPFPSAITGGPSSLAERNLIRSKRYGLPSGQSVARHLGLKPLTNRQLGISATFGGSAPLWFYVLGEASTRTGGGSLGKVGGTIVAATFVGLLKDDPKSILKENKGKIIFGDFTIPQLIEAAGADDFNNADEFAARHPERVERQS